jgi:hypothetical protein
VLLVVALLYAPMLAQRTKALGLLGFVHIGKQMLYAGHSSTKITPSLGWHNDIGYDGQYYFAVAVDPRHAKDYIPPSVSGFVYSRPLYPALAGVTGGGSTRVVPYTMLLINLLAVGAGTLAVAAWLRRRSLTPWLALLYALFPGLVFTAFRDLTEPLAFAFVAVAGLVLDSHSRRATVGAAVLLALAGLTRETTLAFAVGAAALLFRRDRDEGRAISARWARAIAFLAATVAPLLAWRVAVARFVTGPTQEKGDGLLGLVPFHGIGHYWPWHGMYLVIVATIVAPTVLALAVAATVLRRPKTRISAFLLALNASAFVVFLPAEVDINYGAASRAAIGVLLATIVCLPAWSPDGKLSRRAQTAVVVWSLPWYLVACVLTGFPGVAAMTL